MIKFKISAVLLLSIFICNNSFSQNQIHLTQYMMHQPFINPASIGSYDNLNGALLYKNQWVGLSGAPKIQAFSINSPIGQSKNHVGLTVTNDKLGVRQNMDITGNYAYRMPMSEISNLTLGLATSLKLLQGDYSEVTTNIDDDPLFQSNQSTAAAINFKFGGYYNTKKFYAGFAIPNLLKNTLTGTDKASSKFDFEDMHYYFHSGYSFTINDDFNLNPSVLFKLASGAPLQADINSQIEFKSKFALGLSYRSSKEMAAILSMELNRFIKLAYSYDYAFKELNTISSGTHEVMLLFNFTQFPRKRAIITAPRI